jgi:hypothetical protein
MVTGACGVGGRTRWGGNTRTETGLEGESALSFLTACSSSLSSGSRRFFLNERSAKQRTKASIAGSGGEAGVDAGAGAKEDAFRLHVRTESIQRTMRVNTHTQAC